VHACVLTSCLCVFDIVCVRVCVFACVCVRVCVMCVCARVYVCAARGVLLDMCCVVLCCVVRLTSIENVVWDGLKPRRRRIMDKLVEKAQRAGHKTLDKQGQVGDGGGQGSLYDCAREDRSEGQSTHNGWQAATKDKAHLCARSGGAVGRGFLLAWLSSTTKGWR
jgi:hypothetical protein